MNDVNEKKSIREIINPSLKAKSVFAFDELKVSCDDFISMNASINPESLNNFYETVTKIHPEYKNISIEEFLRRSFIFSGKYLTFAGALMLSDIIRVRAELKYSFGHVVIQEFNIWNAYKNILPRLTAKISGKSAAILKETFINALLHSDYTLDNKINISITPEPAKILIDNPGLVRGSVRNQRLEKIFRLCGISDVKQKGLNTVKKYFSSFKLEQDLLNFRTVAKFKIEGLGKLPEPKIL